MKTVTENPEQNAKRQKLVYMIQDFLIKEKVEPDQALSIFAEYLCYTIVKFYPDLTEKEMNEYLKANMERVRERWHLLQYKPQGSG